MKHLLAYGNSDQASFRSTDVRTSLDYMTVPGTIAAYYAEATSAFARSAQIRYLIDPRTPLFQGQIDTPRPSHLSLAACCGADLLSTLTSGARTIGTTYFTGARVASLVSETIGFQKGYSTSPAAASVAKKLARYRRLLQEKMGPQAPDPEDEFDHPAFLLAPYFAVASASDPWVKVNDDIWQIASQRDDANQISPVVCVGDVALLEGAVKRVPAGLSDVVFFWVAGFDERTMSVAELTVMWKAVESLREGRSLVNLYGGFFSICLGKVGLFGFNNGLGYSESRAWPQLGATGAAPARYYVPKLHMFLPPATAAQLLAVSPLLVCPCDVCRGTAQVASLSYEDLKRHFALTRKWEIELVGNNGPTSLADILLAAKKEGEAGSIQLPSAIRPDLDFLGRWEAVLRAFP